MAAFSNYQYHHPCLLDSSPFLLSAFGEHPLINTTTQLPPISEISSNFANYKTSSADNQRPKMTISDNEPSVAKTHTPETSMVVDKVENGDQVNQKEKKKRRNYRNGSSLSFSPSKEATEGRNKKQKKRNKGVVKEEEKPKEQKKEEEKKEQKKIPQEPPTGYIHVRARRGQATDSHSLAERVRREKISERMNMLQRLVPGCDKVTGKALVLDEIINYVQSLQHQVEFLSMKLASVNPTFCDFTMGQDTLMVTPDRLNGLASPQPSVPQCSTNQGMNFADHYFLDSSVSVFLQGQRSNAFSSQDAVSDFWDAEDQRQKFPNPCVISNNLCSFQC